MQDLKIQGNLGPCLQNLRWSVPVLFSFVFNIALCVCGYIQRDGCCSFLWGYSMSDNRLCLSVPLVTSPNYPLHFSTKCVCMCMCACLGVCVHVLSCGCDSSQVCREMFLTLFISFVCVLRVSISSRIFFSVWVSQNCQRSTKCAECAAWILSWVFISHKIFCEMVFWAKFEHEKSDRITKFKKFCTFQKKLNSFLVTDISYFIYTQQPYYSTRPAKQAKLTPPQLLPVLHDPGIVLARVEGSFVTVHGDWWS